MKKQKGLALVLAALMLLSCVGAAAEEAAGSLMGSKKAAPTELTEDNRETTVTLSLPSEEYKNKVDVVFVMDNSTSITNADLNFNDEAKELFDHIIEQNPNIDLKVGVVKFRGYATDMLGSGLTAYEGNESAINEAIANNTVPGSGSNVHSGLRMAEDLLSNDKEVDGEHKYVVLLTDGKSYIWNNDDDEPVTYYSQHYEWNKGVQSGGKALVSQTANSKFREQGKSYSYFPTGTGEMPFSYPGNHSGAGESAEYYQWLFDLSANDLSSTSTVYDFPCYYTKYYDGKSGNVATGTVETTTPSNAAEAFSNATDRNRYKTHYDFTPDGDYKGLRFLSVNPYNLTDDGLFDTSAMNEDFFLLHPDCLQKGTWQAGHFWKETLASKYHTAAITSAKPSGGVNIAASFSHWLVENSERGASVSNASDVQTLFDDIENSINYLVNKGTVTDQIKDDFTLKESDAPFTVTVSGKALAVTKTGDSSWVFGDSLPVEEGPVYPYEISYDAAAKTITWVINVPVEIANPVTLSYDLVLREDAESGIYDTNEYAILDYESTDGEKGTFTFPIPQVTYTKPEPTVKPTATPKPVPPANEFRMFFYKEWPDGEPTDIFFTLYQPNGSVYKHAFKKTKVSDTKFLYEAWLSNDAEYFVIETAMAGYNTAYKNTGAHADVTDRCFKGGTIINTKIPVTGDSMTSLWVLLALVSAGAIALLARKKT